MESIQLKDYPYEVYDDGTVYRTPRQTRYGWNLKRLKIYPTKSTNGYLIVKLYCPKDDSYKRIYLHRLVYMAFNGDIPEGYEVEHRDSNRQNCALVNLRAVTHKENCSNEVSMERYRIANALDKGKFNRDKMIAAQGMRSYDKVVRVYKRLVKEHGHCGIWKLMKNGHCGYQRAKKIVNEIDKKNGENQRYTKK